MGEGVFNLPWHGCGFCEIFYDADGAECVDLCAGLFYLAPLVFEISFLSTLGFSYGGLFGCLFGGFGGWKDEWDGEDRVAGGDGWKVRFVYMIDGRFIRVN